MSRQWGFSLIELMIVVVVVGIISAVAYPSYLEYVQRARRATAQSDLVELAQWLERLYTVNGYYVASGAAVTLPFKESPKEGGRKFYDIRQAQMNADAFELRAIPKGSQRKDACGTLSYNERGVRGASGKGAGCWDE